VSDPDKTQGAMPPGPASAGAGVIVSADARRDERVPPGQVRTPKWPVLDAHGTPDVDLATWTLEIGGLVEHPLSFTWEQFRALPRVKVFADFHCVTTWSRLGNLWEGVAVRELLARAKPRPEARFAFVTSADRGWTTNLPLADLDAEDALVADTHDGEPLPKDHGGPARLVVPRLYAWKSAKWVRRIELAAEDRLGFWEKAGYHERGDPWTEERFRGA
jgi:DMSO/TMAO reductase YedYZ molybdopterin-dependent catalytic subunit